MKKDTRDGSGLIVGVDLGDRFSRYCVLDQQGQILEEDTIATTGRAFRSIRVELERKQRSLGRK
jgi:predicted NBD/HSP70 family sugar kinase